VSIRRDNGRFSIDREETVRLRAAGP